MDSNMVMNLSPVQVLLTLAFQIWLIVFPIFIIRKLNYIINILEDQFYPDNESSS